MAEMTLPNSSTLDDVVESLKEMNKKSTTLQEEALIYAEELNEKLVKDGPKMDQAQKLATENLIATLESGRLDELEAQKEELLRKRASDKLDKKRNSTLLDSLRQLRDQFKLLKKSFKELLEKKGPLGFLFSLAIRSAVFGLATGIIVGFLEPWRNVGSAVLNAFTRFGKTVDAKFSLTSRIIDPLRLQIKLFSFRLKEIFGKTTGKEGALTKMVRFVRTFFNDTFALTKMIGGNMLKVLTAFTGLITGRVGAFQGIFSLAKAPPLTNPLFQFFGRIVDFLTRPFRFFGAKMGRLQKSLVIMIDGISDTLTGGKGFFSQMGTKLSQIFSGKTARQFFGLFKHIKGAFFGIGKVIGNILRPVLAIFGFVKGFRDNLGKEEDKFNNLLRATMGGIAKAFELLVSTFLDLGKQGMGFLLDVIVKVITFGFASPSFRKTFKKFSFVDFFNNIFNTITDTVINFLNTIRDKVADIGIGGIVRNIGLTLMGILMKIAAFPAAVASAAVAAVGAALPGGESPGEAFKRKFSEVMSGIDTGIDALKTKSDGLDSDGNIIDALSEEGKELEAQRKAENSLRGQVRSFFRGGDTNESNTTLISDGGFGSRIRNFKTNMANRYFDD